MSNPKPTRTAFIAEILSLWPGATITKEARGIQVIVGTPDIGHAVSELAKRNNLIVPTTVEQIGLEQFTVRVYGFPRGTVPSFKPLTEVTWRESALIELHVLLDKVKNQPAERWIKSLRVNLEHIINQVQRIDEK